jgi:hypothetical protein
MSVPGKVLPMQIIRDEWGTKTQELTDIHSTFVHIIGRFEDIYNVRPFNQQTAQSLTELFALVHAVRPRTIFELGAGSRSSTVALSLAAARLPRPPSIFSVDVAPADFGSLAAVNFPDLRFAPVEDIAMEATGFRIPETWEHPIFMLYDAHDHDIAGIEIFPHARDAWFPAMASAVVAVHDCSVYETIRPDLPAPYHQAVYAPDVTLAGYGEVPGLVTFLHDRSLALGLPGREMETLGVGGEGTSLIYFRLPQS